MLSLVRTNKAIRRPTPFLAPPQIEAPAFAVLFPAEQEARVKFPTNIPIFALLFVAVLPRGLVWPDILGRKRFIAAFKIRFEDKVAAFSRTSPAAFEPAPHAVARYGYVVLLRSHSIPI